MTLKQITIKSILPNRLEVTTSRIFCKTHINGLTKDTLANKKLITKMGHKAYRLAKIIIGYKGVLVTSIRPNSIVITKDPGVSTLWHATYIERLLKKEVFDNAKFVRTRYE